MIKPGSVVFKTPDDEGAADMARDFCKTRGLTTDNARIIRKGGEIQVEIKKPCLLKVSTTPKPKS